MRRFPPLSELAFKGQEIVDFGLLTFDSKLSTPNCGKISDGLRPVNNLMLHLSHTMFNLIKSWLKNSLMAILLVTIFLGISTAGWTPSSSAALPAGNAITDGRSLLRYALPINNEPVRQLQASLEDISNQLRANRRWGSISKDLSKASRVLDQPSKILASVPEERQPQAKAWIEELKSGVNTLQELVKVKDKEKIQQERNQLLNLVTRLEESMVKEFPFEVPKEYSNLPQLKGRATVDIKTNKGDLTVVVDGYSAPVTAGNFVDLVQRGFYNGLEFTRAEESYFLQTGDPPGKDVGFIEPKTGKYRAIPLEILVEGDKAPTYGITLEEAGRYVDMPVLPFSSFGAVVMARPESQVNGASSQFFFFLFEPELTPAGRNLLDGRYAVFGYLTEGEEVLDKLKAGDKIESATVVQGIENLVQPEAA
ncbi:peptidyl-prolyl cis-trans isomerase cyclophilin type peptidyl-prolyl cis-trans isomerase [Calothrix sp. NIES-2098]|nr:peptidyl-prolyl cis-trans isomerase cyclophilin type peptidyl-prolyl cis-trans isomerase [Calothrix sp. NIES-2098]